MPLLLSSHSKAIKNRGSTVISTTYGAVKIPRFRVIGLKEEELKSYQMTRRRLLHGLPRQTPDCLSAPVFRKYRTFVRLHMYAHDIQIRPFVCLSGYQKYANINSAMD